MKTGSGFKAIEIIESKHPDLIILDVRLPDLDGIEVCKSLKTNPNTAQIPILMITGLSDQNIRQQALLAGADVFLPRPFEGDDFTGEIQGFTTPSKLTISPRLLAHLRFSRKVVSE